MPSTILLPFLPLLLTPCEAPKKRDSHSSMLCLAWLLFDSRGRTDLSSATDHERADSAPGVAGASVSCQLLSFSAQFTGSQCSSSQVRSFNVFVLSK